MPKGHDTKVLLRWQELINLLLLRVPPKECARRLGVHERTIARDMAHVDFLVEFNSLNSDVRSKVQQKVAATAEKSLAERINQASGEAIEKLRHLIESEHQGLALKACDSVLDRNVETARCQHVESDVRGRFSIDSATLMHVAMVATEIEGDRRRNQPILPSAIDGETTREETCDRP